MKPRSANKKIANGLVAASAAAVLAVYSAGYARTRSAADQFEGRAAERRPPAPRPARTESPIADFQPVALNTSAPSVTTPASTAGGSTPAIPAKADAAANPTLIASAKSIQPKALKTTLPDGTTAPSSDASSSATTTPAPAAPAVTQTAVQPATPPANDYKAIIAAALPPWKDGKYDGWGTCRHGDLQVSVVIEDGKISSANVSQCLTRYSCDIIDKLPGQVVQKQSPEVSYVSGATQSTDAYYWAVVVALGKAK